MNDQERWRLDEALEEISMLNEQMAIMRSALVGPGWFSWARSARLTRKMELLLRAMLRVDGVCPLERLIVAHTLDRPREYAPDSKIIQVQICKLRQLLPAGAIETVWGRGYRLTEIGRAWVSEKEKLNASSHHMETVVPSVAPAEASELANG